MTEAHLRLRLNELIKEYQKGKDRLLKLEQDKKSVEQTMLRIDGAIELLNEILSAGSGNDQ